ncbi:redoxin domain-containing protein [Galactobacter valiniphilus]|uniref:redoxin domain-containing protein n=1 Tax=Galactobacter valiniphilus TaxID=2676122 RepID=UPI0037357C84
MNPLLVGAQAPDFELPNQYGEAVNRAALAGAPALLVFFPLAFTPVCEGELAALAAAGRYGALGTTRVVGLSVDHRYALRDAADRLGVGFDLLSDFWPHGEVAQAYGAFDPVRGHATRVSYLVDPACKIVQVFTSEHSSPRSVEDYRAAVGGLRRP